METPQKDTDYPSPFISNWVLGASLLSLATAVGMGVYCQMPSAKNQKETTQKEVAEILTQPKQ